MLSKMTPWSAVTVVSLLCVSLHAAPPSPRDLARQVDERLAAELGVATWPDQVGDTTFLRRVFLDTVGKPPTPEDVLAFLADERPDKRERVIQALLADNDFGLNWARYWRDVILARKTDPRAVIVESALVDFLSHEMNEGRGWDEIARQFITAEGDVSQDGATAIFMAQQGKPEDSAAEISRIFCGIQIQCAQCHDHPTDSWTREQFHQFAAFFPRVAVRPNRQGERRTFLVTVTDRSPFFRRRGPANNRYVGTLEHRMPDLQNPEAPGEVMVPKFFVGGQTVSLGTRDADRRGALAEWLAGPDNPWFATAYVNRIWAELIGHGFYEPVDDIGPERDVRAPETLALLARGFEESGYDIKWLMETIMSTRVYRQPSVALADCSNCSPGVLSPQRLRADQLFDAMGTAVGISLDNLGGQRRNTGPYRAGPRQLFRNLFGYDPSDPRAEVQGSLAQVLALMNSRFTTSLTRGAPGTPLGRIIATQPTDRDVIDELYLRTLSRFPSATELHECLQHVREADSRATAYEDLLWVLINSTEFLYRR